MSSSSVLNQLVIAKHKPNEITEYWFARDIQKILGYSKWSNFQNVIQKAIESCEGTGIDPQYHFAETGKMVNIGRDIQREIEDYYLSRYACYLIAMNGEPSKIEIATAQSYFAIQSTRMEEEDRKASTKDRIEMRSKVKEANKNLFGTAKSAGVKQFAVFNNAGYRGLYGMNLNDVKSKKGIGKDELLDRAGHTELAANYFRITQADQKIILDNIDQENAAISAHEEVGKTVRDTIMNIGGEMPENLKPEENIKKLEKSITAKKLKQKN